MESIQLRRHRPADVPAILAATAQTAWEQLSPLQQLASDRMQVTQRAMHTVASTLRSAGTHCLVAEDRGELVGYEILALKPDELTGAVEALKVDGWVAPAYRGRGINALLHQAGEQWCRHMGVRRMVCVVATHNLSSLHATDKVGFLTERVIRAKWL